MHLGDYRAYTRFGGLEFPHVGVLLKGFIGVIQEYIGLVQGLRFLLSDLYFSSKEYPRV